MLLTQIILTGVLFLLGAFSDTIQFAPALYSFEQTASCVIINLPFIPFALDTVQTFLGQGPRATQQLRLTCNSLVDGQNSKQLLWSFTPFSNDFKDMKLYDIHSAVGANPAASVDLTPSLSRAPMSPASPAQVPTAPSLSPIPEPTIPVNNVRESVHNQTHVICEVEFHQFSFVITQRDCIVSAITAIVVTLLHALVHLSHAWSTRVSVPQPEEYDEDFVPEAAIMLVPWVDCLLQKYGYDPLAAEDEASTSANIVESTTLINPELPLMYEEPIELDIVMDDELPLDASDSNPDDLDPDPTATQPTIVDAALSAIDLATIHETQGASLPQPTSEYVPDNTDVPPTVIQVPADEAEDVPPENNISPPLTASFIHVEHEGRDDAEVKLHQPLVKQGPTLVTDSEGWIFSSETEQHQPSSLAVDIQETSNRPTEIRITVDSIEPCEPEKTAEVDSKMEKPAEAQFTTNDSDEQHSKTTKVKDAGLIQGVEASMHAPKSKAKFMPQTQEKHDSGCLSAPMDMGKDIKDSTLAPSKVVQANYSPPNQEQAQTKGQERVFNFGQEQTHEFQVPQNIQVYSAPTFTVSSEVDLEASEWGPKPNNTEKDNHQVQAEDSASPQPTHEATQCQPVAALPNPETPPATTCPHEGLYVSEDVTPEDEIEWEQIRDHHYGASAEQTGEHTEEIEATPVQASDIDDSFVQHGCDTPHAHEADDYVDLEDSQNREITQLGSEIAESANDYQEDEGDEDNNPCNDGHSEIRQAQSIARDNITTDAETCPQSEPESEVLSFSTVSQHSSPHDNIPNWAAMSTHFPQGGFSGGGRGSGQQTSRGRGQGRGWERKQTEDVGKPRGPGGQRGGSGGQRGGSGSQRRGSEGQRRGSGGQRGNSGGQRGNSRGQNHRNQGSTSYRSQDRGGRGGHGQGGGSTSPYGGGQDQDRGSDSPHWGHNPHRPGEKTYLNLQMSMSKGKKGQAYRNAN